MKLRKIQNGVILEEVQDFDAKHIFECGQCFRWERQQDGSYTGIAFGRVLNVLSDTAAGTVALKNTNEDEFFKIWQHYFDLNRDYGAIKAELAQDPVLATAIQYGEGIRILNQDPWELLVSFLMSINKSIPLISQNIRDLSRMYGSPVYFEGRQYDTFPGPEALAGTDLNEIKACRAGFRCRYIHEAAKLVASGQICLERIKAMPTESAKEALMTVIGVGPKVADCILLFSMQKYDSYPVDVWIKRVTEYFYFDGSVSHRDIRQFAREKFGDLAGFAQQYLFYYARELKINK